MTDINVSNLKVTELRSELSKRNLSTKGKKEELVARLSEAIQNESTQDEQEQESTNESINESEQVNEKQVDNKSETINEKESDNEKQVNNESETVNEKESDKEKESVNEKENVVVEIKDSPKETESTTTTNENQAGIKRKRSIDDDSSVKEALYVKGFIRPLIIRHVQELFSRYGTIKRFWMDSIKTHAYVIYEAGSQAKEAYDTMNGMKFPADTGKLLSAGMLLPEQAEKLIDYEQHAAENRIKVDWEEAIENLLSGKELTWNENTRKSRSIGIGQLAKQLAQANSEPVVTKEVQHVEKKRKELSLDDLFRKTTTRPHLYYLPNTDEEAKVKLQKLK